MYELVASMIVHHSQIRTVLITFVQLMRGFAPENEVVPR